MRRTLIATAAVLTFGLTAIPAHAEVPVHDMTIAKHVTQTIAPLPECPEAPTASVDLEFNLQAHFTGTSETFHYTQTSAGSWIARDAAGAETASGHFVATTSSDGPGFPTYLETDVTKATGRSVDGQVVNIRLLYHVTVTPDGDVVVEFFNVDC